jgi:hypothetical protein
MTLQFADGRPFTTGLCHYEDWEQTSPGQTETPRIFVCLGIGGFQTQAALDTGGVYLVCDPETADLLDPSSGASLGVHELLIRGCRYNGDLRKLTIRIQAEEGKSLELEVTAFIPRLAHGQEWRLPSVLGLQGCLEFLRFAVDPGANTFYFGPIS